MRDRDIDDILRQAGGAQPGVDPALLDRIKGSIGASMRPVRPLPPAWILTGCLILICAAVAAGGALLLGPKGVQKMNALQIGLIFPALAILVWLAAQALCRRSDPGQSASAGPLAARRVRLHRARR